MAGCFRYSYESRAPEPARTEPVGWRKFELSRDDEIAALDEALFELAHLLAALAAGRRRGHEQ
ncbi:MAG TPA: hypothetical protein VF625_05385 [Longimicrobium sp.]